MCVPPFLPGGSEAVGCVRVVVVLLCVAVGVVHIRSLRAPAMGAEHEPPHKYFLGELFPLSICRNPELTLPFRG